jgi:hypothetical protein
LPLPVAKLIAAQGRWSLKRTGITTSIISLGYGLIWAEEIWQSGPLASILLLWLLLAMPAMLIWSAVTNAGRGVGSKMLNLLIAAALWWAGLLLAFVGSAS